jgi:restriction system protein
VQVKRTKNRIGVEQIREFAGALVIGEFTRGIFVTTSAFTSCSREAAVSLAGKGIPIELIDADNFFRKLEITKRKPYSSYDEWRESIGEFELYEVYRDESE